MGSNSADARRAARGRRTWGERISGIAAATAGALRPVIGRVRPDLGRELADRAGAHRRLAEWARNREPGPVVWLHGASAGELLGAEPALRLLRASSGADLLVTWFSPSALPVLPRLRPDLAVPVPLDTAGRCRAALAAVRPAVLAFAKLDVWPGLVGAAVATGVPTALINGVVRRDSGRLGRLSRALLRPTYARLDAVGAATREDADRLRILGVREEALRVTGDAAFDLALDRADAARATDGEGRRLASRLPDRPAGGLRLVAGSTWPADEEALLAALVSWPAARPGRFDWQIVVAPHRPGEAHVRRLLGACREAGQPAVRFSRIEDPAEIPGHGVIVFDEVGRLAELYTAGDVAYVGGGLEGRGLHNVLEPAAAGVPVVFGARHDRADARDLEASGGAVAVAPPGLGDALLAFADGTERRRAGRRARACVEAGSGAAERTAAFLAGVMGR